MELGTQGMVGDSRPTPRRRRDSPPCSGLRAATRTCTRTR